MRLAVNAGEVLVSLGADVAREGIVTGDVINTADAVRRTVNGMLVGDQAYRVTRDRIDYVAHEPLTAKGKSEPVVVRKWSRHGRGWVPVSRPGGARVQSPPAES